MSAAFSADSSCLIAAVCPWHGHHDAAVDAVESRRGAGQGLVLAGYALAKTYAVLSHGCRRRIASHRLMPVDRPDR